MITINKQKELEALIINGEIVIDDDLTINCDINLPGIDIKAWDIDANDIKARNIDARNIDALDIKARNINARNIESGDIKARDIKAWNIKAGDIRASDIKANDISYFSSVIATESLICKSIAGKRRNSLHKCQDQEIQFIN